MKTKWTIFAFLTHYFAWFFIVCFSKKKKYFYYYLFVLKYFIQYFIISKFKYLFVINIINL